MKSKKRLFSDAVAESATDKRYADTSPEKKLTRKLSEEFKGLSLEVIDFERFKKEVIWFAQKEGLCNEFLNRLKASEKETGFLLSAKTFLERLGCKNLAISPKIEDSIINFRNSMRSFLEAQCSDDELSR